MLVYVDLPMKSGKFDLQSRLIEADSDPRLQSLPNILYQRQKPGHLRSAVPVNVSFISNEAIKPTTMNITRAEKA